MSRSSAASTATLSIAAMDTTSHRMNIVVGCRVAGSLAGSIGERHHSGTVSGGLVMKRISTSRFSA